jgi:hypothetical protein
VTSHPHNTELQTSDQTGPSCRYRRRGTGPSGLSISVIKGVPSQIALGYLSPTTQSELRSF